MVNNKDLKSTYLLIGEDTLKASTALKRLKKRLSEFGDISFDSVSFEAQNTNATSVIEACQAVPMICSIKYVLLKNVENFNKQNQEEIAKYITNPIKHTIFVCTSLKLNKNSKLYRAFEKQPSSYVINCEPQKKYQLASLVNSFARSHGASIDYNASNKLLELVGNDTLLLDSYIQKMLIANGNKNITIDQVKKHVTKTNSAKPWDFTNAFSERKITKCLNIYHTLEKGSEYMLIAFLFQRIKELICVKSCKNNSSTNIIASKLGCPTWRIKNHKSWANNFSMSELIDALSKTLNCDKNLKSKQNSTDIFEEYIVDVLS